MPITQIRKRDGRLVRFEPEKIVAAVSKAIESVRPADEQLASSLATKAVEELEKKYVRQIPNVEEIQDVVEHVLIESGHADIAKAYILYRQKRADIRQAKAALGVKDDLKLTVNAVKVLERRYLRKDEFGHIIETPSEMLRRVASNVALADKNYGAKKESIKSTEEIFYDMMSRLEFLPNCLSTCSRVATEQGLVKLGDIKTSKKQDGININVVTDNGLQTATDYFANGPKKVWRIKTAYGYSIVATPQHNFRVIDKNGLYVWKQLQDIKKDDYLALQKDFLICTQDPELTVHDYTYLRGRKRKPLKYPKTLTPELAELIGYSFADGYVKRIKGTESTLQLAIYENDRDIVEHFKETINMLFSIVPRITKIKNKNCLLMDISNRNFIQFLEKNGLLKIAKAKNITVPDAVFCSSRNTTEAFIRGVFEADGTVGDRTIELYSISYEFIKNIQLLLLGLGIVSKLKSKASGYRLTIHKDGNGKRFAEQIGFISKRKNTRCREFLTPRHIKDYIPRQNKRLLEWYKVKGVNYALYKKLARFVIETKYAEVISGSVLKQYTQIYPQLTDCYLYNLSNLNQFYDTIESIEYLEAETADLHVPQNNTYIAEGFVTHNSPTLMNAGTDMQQLAACFVLPLEDSMISIFETLKNAAMIHKTGGGTGFSFSRLRPHGDPVHSTGGVASGPIAFLKVFNAATESVKQGGRRRGANMGILRVDHPDILEFIILKEKEEEMANFNLSVALTDKFMRALEQDKEYDLVNPRTGKIVNKLNARRVFNMIVAMAWKSGDPGVIFIDRMNKSESNPVPELGPVESTNPCGELPLYSYESCNLGSINLSKFVKRTDGKKEIDYEKLKAIVHNAVHFLDNVIDMNKYPLQQVEEVTKANRRIGLGVMGFADMLVSMGVPYNNEEALKLAEKIMKFIDTESKTASQNLAKERGSFQNFKKSIWKNEYKMLRNATTTAIAPTGSISMIAGCSSGIEPLFAVSFIRTVMDKTELVEVNPAFEEISKQHNFYSENLMRLVARAGTIQHIKEIHDSVKKIFVTAHDISSEDHVKMQAVFQKYVDNGVSKTVNCAFDATEEDIENIYLLCYKLGCKGITIYRDRSKSEQVINIELPKGKIKKIRTISGKFNDECEDCY